LDFDLDFFDSFSPKGFIHFIFIDVEQN